MCAFVRVCIPGLLWMLCALSWLALVSLMNRELFVLLRLYYTYRRDVSVQQCSKVNSMWFHAKGMLDGDCGFSWTYLLIYLTYIHLL